MADVATLGIAIDARGVESASQALDRLAAKGKTAESAAAALDRVWAKVGASSRVQDIGATLDAQRAKVGLAALQLNDFGARWRSAKDAIDSASKATASAGNTVVQAADQFRMNANQAQQLSYQLNDLFVQIASGGSPLTALIQQGSQLSGTFGGIGNALKGVLSVLTPARVGFGAAAAALGAFAVAAYEGHEASTRLERSLRLTGGAAGYTRAQVEAMAVTLAQSTKSGIGDAREALTGLVATGRFSGEALQKTAQAVILFQKATGASTDDIIKQFVQMSDDVGKWAEVTNRSYHFVNAAQLQQIKTLQEQGRVQEAITVAMGAFTQRVEPAAQALNWLERALRAVKTEAAGFWDSLVKAVSGGPDTLEQKLAAAAAKVEAARRAASEPPSLGVYGGKRASGAERLQQALQEQAILQEMVRLQNRGAEAAAKTATQEQARARFNKLLEDSMTRQERLAKEIDQARAEGLSAGASEEEINKAIAGIKAKYKDLTPDLSRSLTSLQVDKIKGELDKLLAIYQGSESILEAQRQAGLLSDREYYEAKRAFIALEIDAKTAALEEENELLRREREDEKTTARERMELGRQMEQNEARIAALRTEAAAKGEVLATQSKASDNARAAALDNVRRSLAEYLEDLERRIELEDQLSRLGSQGRADALDRANTAERIRRERRQLETERARLVNARQPTDVVDAQLQALAEKEKKEQEAHEARIQRRKAADADWVRGAQRGFDEYITSASKTADHVESVFTNAFRSLEDVLTDTLTKGKADFKGFVNSIIEGITRIIVQEQLVKPLAQYLQGGMSSGTGLGGFIGSLFTNLLGGGSAAGTSYTPDQGNYFFGDGRAIGGPVSARELYEINERKRPEVLTVKGRDYLLMGAQRGEVKPAAEQQPQIVNNINIAAGVTRAELQQTAERLAAQMRAEQMRASRTGTGVFSRY